MKLFKRICSILIAAALILTIFAVVLYSGTSAEAVCLTASFETVTAGEQVDVEISLTAYGVYGVQMVIGYDNGPLTAANVSVAPAVTDAGLHYAVNAAYSSNAVSVMIYGVTQIPVGVIAAVTFDTDGETDTDTVSAITFDSFLLSDQYASAVTGASAINGSVTVKAPLSEPEQALRTYAKNLKLGSDVTLNVYVDPAYVETYGYSDLYIEFSLSDRHRTVYPDAERVNGYLQFSFRNINPYEFTQDISITVYGTFDGRLYSSETQTYSVVTYCANTFKKANVSDAAKTMIADMLNYGAAVQTYVGRYTDTLCNQDEAVAGYVSAYETKSAPALSDISDKSYKTVEAPGASWLGANLVLGSAVSMQFAFNTAEDINDLEVRIYDGGTLKQTFTGDGIVYDADGGFYYVKFSKYGAAYMSRAAYAEIYKNGVKISNSYRYSIESYACRMLEKSSSQTLKDVCTTMMKYGNAAAAYVAS